MSQLQRHRSEDVIKGKLLINELMCLSAIMFGEARGESDIGKVAVAYTAINRKADPNYPKDICKIMKQPAQYEFLQKKGMPEEYQYKYLYPIAKAVMEGKIDDPTRGAKWFHNKQIKPYWIKNKEVKLAVGNHIFY
jgi:spore germination cell wall hydrolase CwlJ-like protein